MNENPEDNLKEDREVDSEADAEAEAEAESLEITQEFADNLEERSFDHLYEDLKLEILKKQSKDDTGHPYYCKVCGTEKRARLKIPTCLNCGAPVCEKCRSCGFCLNCFINLSEDSRKTLKLMRALAWGVPLALLFLKFFRTWLDFLLIEVFLVVLFSGLYLYLKQRIRKNPAKYIDHKWQYLVQSEGYQQLLDPLLKKRFIWEGWKNDVENRKQVRIQKLKNWIDPQTDFSDVPIPAHYQEGGFESDLVDHINDETLSRSEETAPTKYKLINKKCPNCGEIIIFADFCPNCNLRFCPECGNENHPYSLQCLCGNSLSELENEYEIWKKQKKIDY